MEWALHNVDGNVGMRVLWAHGQGTSSLISSPGSGPQEGFGIFSVTAFDVPYLLPKGMSKLGQFPIGLLRLTDSLLPRVQAVVPSSQMSPTPGSAFPRPSERTSTWVLSRLVVGVLKGLTSKAACQGLSHHLIPMTSECHFSRSVPQFPPL